MKSIMVNSSENELVLLKKMIDQGIRSGRAKNFNPKKYLEILKLRKKNKGDL